MTIEEAVAYRQRKMRDAAKAEADGQRVFLKVVDNSRREGIPLTVIARRAGMSRQNLYRLMKD